MFIGMKILSCSAVLDSYGERNDTGLELEKGKIPVFAQIFFS
jgi:hypothetical protein